MVLLQISGAWSKDGVAVRFHHGMYLFFRNPGVRLWAWCAGSSVAIRPYPLPLTPLRVATQA